MTRSARAGIAHAETVSPEQVHEGILPLEKSSHSKGFVWVDFEVVDDWKMPGQGQPYPSCGTFFVFGCLEHRPAYGKKRVKNCGRASCPVCGRSWLAKTANNILDRLEKGKPRNYRKVIHITVSPPRELWCKFKTKVNYKKMRRKAIEILKNSGVKGGCIIYHAYRGDNSRGWVFSPHFHVLGYGWIVYKPKYFDEWVVKNLRVRKDTGATAYYQLSHASVKEGHHVVSWFGILSWKYCKVEKYDAPDELCPVCGGVLHHIIYWGTGPNPFEGDDILERSDLDMVQWSYV